MAEVEARENSALRVMLCRRQTRFAQRSSANCGIGPFAVSERGRRRADKSSVFLNEREAVISQTKIPNGTRSASRTEILRRLGESPKPRSPKLPLAGRCSHRRDQRDGFVAPTAKDVLKVAIFIVALIDNWTTATKSLMLFNPA